MQRKNQKLLEEAPCYVLDEKAREYLVNAALKICKALKYNSVGIIEFLVDKYGGFYFMEMNTRIQVEHPITEMIIGIDIIKQQIRIASGLKLNIKQEEIQKNGYSIECRINAENVKKDFAPSPRKINFLNIPAGNGVRIETSAYNGCMILPYYDSMIMKVITFAPTRLACIKKMRIALEELIIKGIYTNIEFQYLLLHSPKFVEGRYDTSFIETFVREVSNNAEII